MSTKKSIFFIFFCIFFKICPRSIKIIEKTGLPFKEPGFGIY